jgi:putative transposase
MPRPPRLDLPGWPMHVTQRGVNRCAIFLDDTDRAAYLRLLRRACLAHGVEVHAYVLMDNHVHLLVRSQRRGDLSLAMHALGHLYVQDFNARHDRVGTLWQGRFRACVVDSGDYLFKVMRYIELNPVRAAMCASAEGHRWSSVQAHLGNRGDATVTFHPRYLALGTSPAKRQATWREWLREGVSDEDLHAIRRHLDRGAALGDERFQAMVARTLNRPVACRPRGRPRKPVDQEN